MRYKGASGDKKAAPGELLMTPSFFVTYPPGLGLVLERLLGVLRGRLHVVDGVLHVVLDAVDHLALETVNKRKLEVSNHS